MNDALKKWAHAESSKNERYDYRTHAHSPAAAEFWLRAFIAEMEKSAMSKNVDRADTKIYLAYANLKRELLG